VQAARGTTLTELPPADAGATAEILVRNRPTASSPRRSAIATLIGVAVLAFGLDLLSKVLVVAHVDPAHPIRLLGGLLHIANTRNPGAAFSIGTGATYIFAGVAVAVIAVIIRSARRLHSIWWAIGLGLTLGGASGNLSDRLFRAPGVLRGQVVDWIQFPHFAIFNAADSAIVGGGGLLIVLMTLGFELDGTRSRHGGSPVRPVDETGRDAG
jgi:signal peptidase II